MSATTANPAITHENTMSATVMLVKPTWRRPNQNGFSSNHFWDRTCRKVNIDHRPSSNRRRHRYTAPPSGICGGSLLASCPRECVGAPFEDDLSLPGLKEGRPSGRDVAFGPLD